MSPVAPFKLGDYRGYDHDWRCWSYDSNQQNATDWGQSLSVTFNLKWFPGWSVEDGTNHLFDILFKRTNDFHQGGYTTISSNVALNNATEYTFTFSYNDPPDGGAALAENDTVYIAIVHKGSNDRRWDLNMATVPPTNYISTDPYWVQAVTVPDDPCHYRVYLSAQTANIYRTASKSGLLGAVTIMVDTRSNQTVTVQTEFCESSAFDVDVQTVTSSDTLAASTSPGTYQARTINIASTPQQSFAVGDTVYYRSRISSVVGGATYETDWSDVASLIVDDELPL